jgi:hypothetical protein
MSIFGRRPNPEEVATQLIEGLENGSLTLDDPTVVVDSEEKATPKVEAEVNTLILGIAPVADGPFLQYSPSAFGITRPSKRRNTGGAVRVSGLLVDTGSPGQVCGYAPV